MTVEPGDFGMEQDDIDELDRLWHAIIEQVRWMTDNDADHMMALLAKRFAGAVRQIKDRREPSRRVLDQDSTRSVIRRGRCRD